MTNIHATGFSSDVTLRPLPASACCTAFSGTRVIRGEKPLSPYPLHRLVAGSGRPQFVVAIVGRGQKIAVAGHQCAERRTARFKFCRGSGIHHTALIAPQPGWLAEGVERRRAITSSICPSSA